MNARTLPAFLRAPGPKVVAHRGGAGLAPENTLPAFENAVRLGVDALEMDVRLTRDRVLVVAHDDTVDRVSDGAGPILDHDLGTLRRLDAGHAFSTDGGATFPFRGRGVRFPTLEEVVRAAPDAGLSLELKPVDARAARELVTLLGDLRLGARACVGTFHHETALLVRRLAPAVATCASPREVARFVRLAAMGLGRLHRDGADAFVVPERAGRWRVLTPRRIHRLRRRARPVHVWTVNEDEDMTRLLAWGVDGIVTDRPDRLLALLGRPAAASVSPTTPPGA